jgi:hypothetical protein
MSDRLLVPDKVGNVSHPPKTIAQNRPMMGRPRSIVRASFMVKISHDPSHPASAISISTPIPRSATAYR